MTTSGNPPSEKGMTTKTPDGRLSYVQRTDLPKPRKLSWYRSGGLLNERRAHRVPFPETLHVVGLVRSSVDGRFVVDSEGFIARGRDISVGGISFRHDAPLPHRFVAVSFRSPFGTETLIAKLLWCRFTRQERYFSGGCLITEPQFSFKLNIDWDEIESGC